MQSTEKAGQGKMTSSVFVEFETLSEAQAAYQSLTHHQALHMSPRFTGINPAEIIWSSLKIKWWELIIRKLANTAFVVALIIFWAIPVAAVGAISNINKLEGTTGFTWLHKIFDPIPSVIMGVITGMPSRKYVPSTRRTADLLCSLQAFSPLSCLRCSWHCCP